MRFVTFIIIWVICTILFLKRRDKYNPIGWLIVAYTFLYGMYFFAGVQYSYDARMSAIIYLLLNVILFAITCTFGKHTVIRHNRNHNMYVDGTESGILLSDNTVSTFKILGYAGVFLYIFDLITNLS